MEKLVIVGGAGEFGKLYATILRDFYDVTVVSRDPSRAALVAESIGVRSGPLECVSDADVVIVSVPIAATPSVITSIGPLMKRDALLMDFTSVKTGIVNVMEQQPVAEVVSCHPMHGPRVMSLEGQVMLFIPVRPGTRYRTFRKIFEEKRMRIYETTAEEHDKTLAIVQVLTHFMYLAGASAIAEHSSFKIPFSTPIYELSRDMMTRVLAQNPSLYAQIQIYNPYGKEIRELFLQKAHALHVAAEKKDEQRLSTLITEVAKEVDDVHASLARSDKVIAAMQAELHTLKNLIGSFVAVENIYSHVVHAGTLQRIDAEHLFILSGTKTITLKISNIRLLKGEELRQWKLKRGTVTRDYSIILPHFDSSVLVSFGRSLHPDVLDVSFLGSFPMPDEKGISVTLRFTLFRDADIKTLDKHIRAALTGIGGTLR